MKSITDIHTIKPGDWITFEYWMYEGRPIEDEVQFYHVYGIKNENITLTHLGLLYCYFDGNKRINALTLERFRKKYPQHVNININEP